MDSVSNVSVICYIIMLDTVYRTRKSYIRYKLIYLLFIATLHVDSLLYPGSSFILAVS